MKKQFLKDALGWGFLLWLIGYALGFVFFFILPAELIGWIIMPIGIAITLWVLIEKIKNRDMRYYAAVAFIWLVIAVALDYCFIAVLLHPADGYYKLDVYLYYAFTFALPLVVGWWKTGGRELH